MTLVSKTSSPCWHPPCTPTSELPQGLLALPSFLEGSPPHKPGHRTLSSCP